MANIKQRLEGAIKKHQKGAVIMMELPAEGYFEAGSAAVKFLTGKSFGGVYVSFQRPFNNVISLLKDEGVNVNKMLFIDMATMLSGEKLVDDPRCIHLSSDVNIDDLVRAIYSSLDRIKSDKKFIFIDSLTTIALYKPLSETMRFSEFLMREVKKRSNLLIFNIAQDLKQKRFIKDIALEVDEVVSLK